MRYADVYSFRRYIRKIQFTELISLPDLYQIGNIVAQLVKHYERRRHTTGRCIVAYLPDNAEDYKDIQCIMNNNYRGEEDEPVLSLATSLPVENAIYFDLYNRVDVPAIHAYGGNSYISTLKMKDGKLVISSSSPVDKNIGWAVVYAVAKCFALIIDDQVLRNQFNDLIVYAKNESKTLTNILDKFLDQLIVSCIKVH